MTANTGENEFKFVVEQIPDKVGVDPFSLLIDRIPDDNTKTAKPVK